MKVKHIVYLLLLVGLFVYSKQMKAQKYGLIFIQTDSIIINKPEKKLFFKDTSELFLYLKVYINNLQNKGYIAASIDSTEWQDNILLAYLYLGTQYKWQELSFDKVEEDAKKELRLRPKDYYDRAVSLSAYLKLRNDLLEYYEKHAFPFASLKADAFSIKDKQFSANLNLQKGRQYFIDTIIVKGNLKIKNRLIYRMIGVKKNDVFSSQKIRDITKNLSKILFLQQAKPPEIEFHQKGIDLYLYLKRKSANYFSGIIGFVSDTLKGNLTLTGNVQLLLNNVFNAAEEINLKWEQYNSNSQLLQIYLAFPYLLSSPLGINLELKMDKTKLDYLNLDFKASALYHFQAGNKIEFFFKQSASNLIGSKNEDNRFANISNNLLGLAFKIDHVNQIIFPDKGLKFDFSTAYGKRKTGNDINDLYEFNLKVDYHWKIGSYFSILMKNNSAVLHNKKGFYENELYKIGGLNSLRGFDEQSFLLSSYSIFTIEPQFFANRQTVFSVFSDFAYLEQQLIDATKKYFATGLGAGMNFNTRAGIFSLYFSVGKIDSEAFRLSNSKVHFGYAARF